MEVSLIDSRMPRLVFIVEGDAEQYFINMHLVIYLSQKFPGLGMHAQKITTNRHLNKKGGNVSYALFQNELKRTAAQGDVLITTMLDFFRLPNDFPGYWKIEYVRIVLPLLHLSFSVPIFRNMSLRHFCLPT